MSSLSKRDPFQITQINLVKERDHIVHILGGLCLKYNSVIASLTTREDDLSLHSVHSMLLTHEDDCDFNKLS